MSSYMENVQSIFCTVLDTWKALNKVDLTDHLCIQCGSEESHVWDRTHYTALLLFIVVYLLWKPRIFSLLKYFVHYLVSRLSQTSRNTHGAYLSLPYQTISYQRRGMRF